MVRAVLEDYRRASVDAALVALFALVEKAAARAAQVTQQDVDAVRAAGWSDEAIYDAITVCALFNFYTTWVDGTGVPGLPDYGPSGERLARDGYVPAEPPATGAPEAPVPGPQP